MDPYNDNDTLILLKILEETQDHNDLLRLFSRIRGEYAFVLLDVRVSPPSL